MIDLSFLQRVSFTVWVGIAVSAVLFMALIWCIAEILELRRVIGMDVQRINIHPTLELAAEITALKLQVEAILSHQQRKAKAVKKILDRGKRK